LSLPSREGVIKKNPLPLRERERVRGDLVIHFRDKYYIFLPKSLMH
jgi:hypothetical protein